MPRVETYPDNAGLLCRQVCQPIVITHVALFDRLRRGACLSALLVDSYPGAPRRNLTAVDALAELVLGYLRDHPNASDTLQGIAEWWILRQQLRVELANLRSALSQLVSAGVLERIGEGESCRYRLVRRPPDPEEKGVVWDGENPPGARPQSPRN